jgi:hypothetical protein
MLEVEGKNVYERIVSLRKQLKMGAKMTHKKIGVTLVFIGLVGALFFFPMKLENGRTCLAHQYIRGEGFHKEGDTMIAHGHSLAREYILPYGLVWWMSIGLAVTGFYFLRKKKTNIGRHECETGHKERGNSRDIQFRKGGNHVDCRDIFTTEKSLVVVNRIESFGNFLNSRKVGGSLKSRKPSGFKGDSGAIRADTGSQSTKPVPNAFGKGR